MLRLRRWAGGIGRRDFAATVLSKAFIFFLLGPLFPLLLGGVFGGIGARVATQTGQSVIAVISSREEFDRLEAARDRLAGALEGSTAVQLVHYAPEPDVAAQSGRLLAVGKPPVRAVLSGGLESPHLTGAVSGDAATLAQLKLILANARSAAPQSSPPLGITNVTAS